jgi:hypothetical protein
MKMERVTFEEYKNAIETVNRYMIQCEKDLSIIQADDIMRLRNLIDVPVGHLLKVVRNIGPSTYFKKGDTFKVLNKNERKGLQIRHPKGGVYWIPFSNTYGRWGI